MEFKCQKCNKIRDTDKHGYILYGSTDKEMICRHCFEELYETSFENPEKAQYEWSKLPRFKMVKLNRWKSIRK